MQALKEGDKRAFLGSVNILPRESLHKDSINLKNTKTGIFDSWVFYSIELQISLSIPIICCHFAIL